MGKATLSLSTNAFVPEELIPCLECAAKLGLAGVEVGPRNAARLFESVDELGEARGALLRLRLRVLSVHAWTGVEGLEDVCPFTELLGGELIVVHSPPQALDADFEGEAAGLTEWEGWCRRRGIRLTVENSSRQVLAPFAELFKAVPGLGLTLDVKHAYKPETLGTTHKDFMRELGDRAANFHISGIDRARDGLGDGVPPGHDHVSWSELARDLVARKYAGTITAELTFPRHLTEEEIRAGYCDLTEPDEEWPTLSHRLAQHGVEFFRRVLAPALGG